MRKSGIRALIEKYKPAEKTLPKQEDNRQELYVPLPNGTQLKVMRQAQNNIRWDKRYNRRVAVLTTRLLYELTENHDLENAIFAPRDFTELLNTVISISPAPPTSILLGQIFNRHMDPDIPSQKRMDDPETGNLIRARIYRYQCIEEPYEQMLYTISQFWTPQYVGEWAEPIAIQFTDGSEGMEENPLELARMTIMDFNLNELDEMFRGLGSDTAEGNLEARRRRSLGTLLRGNDTWQSAGDMRGLLEWVVTQGVDIASNEELRKYWPKKKVDEAKHYIPGF